MKTRENNKTKNKTAVTFIEIMISSIIMLLLAAMILTVMTSGNNIFNQDMGLIELQQKVRQTLYNMSRELRQAQVSSVTVNAANDNVSFSIVDDVTDTTSATTYDISYYLDAAGTSIVRENPDFNPNCNVTWNDNKCSSLVNNVNSIDFCCIGGSGTGSCTDCADAHTVEIGAELEKTVRGQVLSFSLKKKVRLRN